MTAFRTAADCGEGEKYTNADNKKRNKSLLAKIKSKAHLIGTNHCKNSFLGYHKTDIFNKGKMGYDSPIYTSYVNGRPFIFEEIGDTILNPGNGMGWWALNISAKKHWSKIEI